jgi:glycolate oxidase FAD binding subunit
MSSARPAPASEDAFRRAVERFAAGSDVAAAPVIDGVQAAQALAPASEEEAAAILSHAGTNGLAVIPFGGGSHLGLGNPPERYDVALSMRRLSGIVAYEPADMTLTVQAGMKLADVARLLSEHGQLLPLNPPGGPDATVGGVVAANAQGPLRQAYGTARDWVIGMRTAMADGTVVKAGGRVVKNVTGYDLHKLHIGGLGTLGVVTEVAFKLAPLPRSRTTVVASFPSADAAEALIARASDGGLPMLAAELLSPSAARAVTERDAWSALIMFGAGEQAIARSLRDAKTLARELSGTIDTARDDGEFATWGELFASGDVVLRASVRPTAVSAVMSDLQTALLEDAPMLSATAAAGLVRVRLTTADEAAPNAIAVARDVVSRHDGFVIVERAAHTVKSAIGDVFGAPRPDIDIMRRLKQAYDPQRVLSPGRFMGRL